MVSAMGLFFSNGGIMLLQKQYSGDGGWLLESSEMDWSALVCELVSSGCDMRLVLLAVNANLLSLVG